MNSNTLEKMALVLALADKKFSFPYRLEVIRDFRVDVWVAKHDVKRENPVPHGS